MDQIVFSDRCGPNDLFIRYWNIRNKNYRFHKSHFSPLYYSQDISKERKTDRKNKQIIVDTLKGEWKVETNVKPFGGNRMKGDS